MGMKQQWFADVLTINAKDPALYRPQGGGPPASGSGASPAVFVDIEEDGLLGEFAEHPGEYAEWNVNAWLFRGKRELVGTLVYARDTDTFHIHNGEDLTLPLATGSAVVLEAAKPPEPQKTKATGEQTPDRGFEKRKKEAEERKKEAEAKAAEQKEASKAAKGKAGGSKGGDAGEDQAAGEKAKGEHAEGKKAGAHAHGGGPFGGHR